MNNIKLKLDETNKGAFVIDENGERLAEMVLGINKDNLIVYHTEVSEKLKGQGIGMKLLDHMVTYARENKLKVVALCPFVNAQFKRHPDKYADVWNKNWR